MFKINVVTEEDRKKEKLDIISKLTEEQKSDFVFNGEDLYYVSHGHAWGNGYYIEYITKNGIEAICYSDFWSIDNKRYDYIDNEFVEIIEVLKSESNINWETFSFPIVKNVNPKTLANELKIELPR